MTYALWSVWGVHELTLLTGNNYLVITLLNTCWGQNGLHGPGKGQVNSCQVHTCEATPDRQTNLQEDAVQTCIAWKFHHRPTHVHSQPVFAVLSFNIHSRWICLGTSLLILQEKQTLHKLDPWWQNIQSVITRRCTCKLSIEMLRYWKK